MDTLRDYMNHFELQNMIELALSEDMAFHDLTAKATIDADQQGQASIVAKANGSF